MQILKQAPLAALIVAAFGTLSAPVLAQTTSPFAPPDEKFGTYVVNSGSGLDTGCTFRSGSPLRIKIKLPKVVNDAQLNADGTLKDAAKLVASGVLSAQATLRFPVFDIDDKDTSQGVAPEVDRVTFNGKFKKTLEGFNNTWTDDSIIVPIEELKFGQDNELQIDIDTANANDSWCMQVDWLAVEFEAAAPYVLAHGISANRDTWLEADAAGVLRALEERGVLVDRFSLGAGQSGNGAVATNAAELNTQIKAYLDPLKAKKVHVIAHSKGGLDTQGLQAQAPEFEILSLSTLSTPHLGSVAADLSIIAKATADDKIASGQDPNGWASLYLGTWTFGKGPQLPGLADLTTYGAATALANGLRNNIGNTFTFGADADLNGDGLLTSDESAPLFPSIAHHGAERAWNVLRNFRAATMTTATVPGRFWGTRSVLTYTLHQAPAPQANDIVVTLGSANPGYGAPLGNMLGNHSTVKNADNVNTILDKTIPIK
jgi:triacylglycerol lipase